MPMVTMPGSVAHAGYGRKWAGRTAVPVATDCWAARAVARLVQASAGGTGGAGPAGVGGSRAAGPAGGDIAGAALAAAGQLQGDALGPAGAVAGDGQGGLLVGGQGLHGGQPGAGGGGVRV